MTPLLFLAIALGCLAIDAAIELGFISATVAFMHNGAPHSVYAVHNTTTNTSFNISGLPAHLLVDQGHTSNGAAGTAFVLIAALGLLVLAARAWATRHHQGLPARLARGLYYLWMALQVPALLLTTGALAYVFIVTHSHSGQTIDQAAAAAIADAATEKYALDVWTPQNWFAAVTSQLALVDVDLQGSLVWHLRIMRGWQYNLIPLFLVQLAETGVAFWDFWYWRIHVYNHIPFQTFKA